MEKLIQDKSYIIILFFYRYYFTHRSNDPVFKLNELDATIYGPQEIQEHIYLEYQHMPIENFEHR
jgi:hypothetical protein